VRVICRLKASYSILSSFKPQLPIHSKFFNLSAYLNVGISLLKDVQLFELCYDKIEELSIFNEWDPVQPDLSVHSSPSLDSDILVQHILEFDVFDENVNCRKPFHLLNFYSHFFSIETSLI
jgi:hypothetical protein